MSSTTVTTVRRPARRIAALAGGLALASLALVPLPLATPAAEAPTGEAPTAGLQASGQEGGDDVLQRAGEPFEALGVHLDVERGLCAVTCEVMVRDDLLEYLVVGPRGASHETLLATEVVPSVLNAALLLLGVEPGRNARWQPVEPPPSQEELRAGADPYEVTLPEGDGFYIYVAWREGDETHSYRMEDLLRNLKTGRSMRRHRWVYLGSRMVRLGGENDEEAFAADLESNIINVSFFPEGNTLVTGAIEDCVFQTIWLPNAWLLPPRGTTVSLILARERFAEVPADLLDRLPAHDPAELEAAAASGVRRR